MPNKYCGKQQYGFCIWPLGRLRTIEASFGAKITTVGVMMYGEIDELNLYTIERVLKR